MRELISVNRDMREIFEAIDVLLEKLEATDNGKEVE
jgi:hypothetical protein